MNEYARNNRHFSNVKEFRQHIRHFFNVTLPDIADTLNSWIIDHFQVLLKVMLMFSSNSRGLIN